MRTSPYQHNEVALAFERAGRRELADLNAVNSNPLFFNPVEPVSQIEEPAPAIYSSNSKACFDARSSPNRPKFRTEDFSAPRLRLLRSKKDIADDLERDFQKPLSKNENSAFVHGPLGARVSDVLLDRAIKKHDQEKTKVATEDGTSNIVILGKGKLSCHMMARRLLRMVDPEKRIELAQDIEVLDTYKPVSIEGPKRTGPKIIFIPLDTLSGVLSNETTEARRKRVTDHRSEAAVIKDLTQLKTYINAERLKYFYFDKAHLLGSVSRDILLRFFLRNMDARQKTGVKEIIGTSFCNDYYSDGDEEEASTVLKPDEDINRIADVRGRLDRWYYMDSPEELTNLEIPTFRDPEPKITNIGKELPAELQVRGKAKNWVYGRDYAENQEWIKEHFTPVVQEYLVEMQAEARNNPRVLITVDEISQMHLLRDILKEDYNLPVAWTNGEENKYISLDASGKFTEHCEAERIDLIDKFGKDFNVLIHCKALEGEEIPADATMVFKIPRTSSRLEALIASSRTPYDEEENRRIFNERPRNTWLLEVGKPFNYNGEQATVLDLYYGINDRHQKKHEASGDLRGQINQDHGLGAGLEGLDPDEILRLKNLRLTDHDPYYESVRQFGGNPHWLKFLDEVVIADTDAAPAQKPGKSNIDAKISKLADETVALLRDDPSYEDLTSTELTAIIRGKESGRKDKRELLRWALDNAGSDITISYIVAHYPSVTGIESVEEARACVNIALAETPTGQVGLTDNLWFRNLSRVYGGSEAFIARMGDFFYNSDEGSRRIYLYDPKLLREAVAVLAGATTSLGKDSSEGETLLKDFIRFISHDDKFSVIAASEAKPELFKRLSDRSRSRARNDVNFVINTHQINPNPQWMQTLDKALGIVSLDIQRRINYISDYIYDRHNAFFRSAADLEFALRALMGAELNPNQIEPARKLLKEFVAYINNYSTRVGAYELNQVFPEVFPLADVMRQNEQQRLSIEQTLRSMQRDQANTAWLALLDAIPETVTTDRVTERARLYDQYIASLAKQEREAIFENQDRLTQSLIILQGGQKIRNQSGDASARKLFRGFFEFLRLNYPDRFNLYKAYKLYPIIDIESLAQSDVSSAHRICAWASEGHKPMAEWIQLVDQACAINPASANTERTNLIADYLRETNQNAEFRDPVEVCRTLLNPNLHTRPDLAQKNQVRNFVSWINTRTAKVIDPEALVDCLPQYFGFDDIRRNRTSLANLIYEALAGSDINLDEEWCFCVDLGIQARRKSREKVDHRMRAEYLADFLISKNLQQIQSVEDLNSCLNTLLACDHGDNPRKLGATKKLFADFALYVKNDLPSLSVARINHFFPDALPGICSDINADDSASLTDVVSATLSNKQQFMEANRNSQWLRLLARSCWEPSDSSDDRNRKFIDLLVGFLKSLKGTEYLTNDSKFLVALKTLTGEQSVRLDKKILLDFLDYINANEDLVPIQRLEAYACLGDIVPIDADIISEELTNRYKLRPAKEAEAGIESGTEIEEVQDQSTPVESLSMEAPASLEADDSSSAEPADPPRKVTVIDSEIDLVRDICRTYGINEATLFGFFPVSSIDPDLWTKHITELINDSFELPPSRPPRRVVVSDGIAELLKQDYPNRTVKMRTIEDPAEQVKRERKKLTESIINSVVKDEDKGAAFLSELFRKRLLVRKIFPGQKMFSDPYLGSTRPTLYRGNGRGDYRFYAQFYLDKIIYWVKDDERPEEKGRRYVSQIRADKNGNYTVTKPECVQAELDTLDNEVLSELFSRL